MQELQNEVNCMNDSMVFEDAESVRSGQLSHVLSQPALFPRTREQGRLLTRDQSPRPDIFAGLHATASTPHAGMLNSWCSDVTGNIPVLTGTGKPLQRVEIKAKTPSLLRDFYEDRQDSFNPI